MLFEASSMVPTPYVNIKATQSNPFRDLLRSQNGDDEDKRSNDTD